MSTYTCTICGDRNVEYLGGHLHNPNGQPIDMIKLFVLENAPALWDDEYGN